MTKTTKNKILKIVLTVAIFLIFLLAAPAALIGVGFGAPPQYGATYYAELQEMYARLKNTKGKRIIVVGGSSVAFGLRGDLMEREIEGYTVCPFGLYASIGTKFMMDLSKTCVREGDVVLLLPEQTHQSLSLYFGAEHVWKAADGNFEILGGAPFENAGALAGAYPAFVSQKYDYLIHNSAPNPTDVYAKSSFDERCTLVYPRPHNVMEGGVDGVITSYRNSVADEEFLAYVNEYHRFLNNKGATLYFGFCPVNESSVETGTTAESIEDYRAYLSASLECEVMGTPQDYLFEKEWFYDSNVHCNSAGAIVYTRRLVKDLKGCLGDSSRVEIELPEKPELPQEQAGEGDNTNAGDFLYEEDGDGLKITGMTEEGKRLSKVTVPVAKDGKRVTGFTKETFAGNTAIEEIALQANIRSIEDGSFSGCTSLKKLIVPRDTPPNRCTVYFALTEGAPDLKIYVQKKYLSQYGNDYFWSRYAALLVAYD